MSDEILDIAHGDPRLARAVRRLLDELTEHDSEKVREMARDVIDGASLRQMAASSVYGDDIGTAIGTFWHTYQQMSPEQRAELEDAGRKYLNP